MTVDARHFTPRPPCDPREREKRTVCSHTSTSAFSRSKVTLKGRISAFSIHSPSSCSKSYVLESNTEFVQFSIPFHLVFNFTVDE